MKDFIFADEARIIYETAPARKIRQRIDALNNRIKEAADGNPSMKLNSNETLLLAENYVLQDYTKTNQTVESYLVDKGFLITKKMFSTTLAWAY